MNDTPIQAGDVFESMGVRWIVIAASDSTAAVRLLNPDGTPNEYFYPAYHDSEFIRRCWHRCEAGA